MQNQKQPQYIQGYWRNKQNEEQDRTQEQGDALMALILIGGVTIELAILLWRITLPLAALAALAYAYRVWRRRQATGLKINRMA